MKSGVCTKRSRYGGAPIMFCGVPRGRHLAVVLANTLGVSPMATRSRYTLRASGFSGIGLPSASVNTLLEDGFSVREMKLLAA